MERKAITLIALTALATTILSFLKPIYYQHFAYSLLWVIMLAVLISVSIFSKKARHIHIFFALFILSAFAMIGFNSTEFIELGIGESEYSALLNATIRHDRYITPTISNNAHKSEIAIFASNNDGREAIVSTNKPVSYRGKKIYQYSQSFYPDIQCVFLIRTNRFVPAFFVTGFLLSIMLYINALTRRRQHE